MKNILIFSDGTGQEGGRAHNTNVYKLFNMVEDRTPRQLAFYDRGVGTGLGFLTGLAFGVGFARNVLDCYRFIFEQYQAGDRIFLFGFSRGAATVRSLSYFIHLFGILPHSRPELIGKAWRIYKWAPRDQMVERAQAFIRKHNTMWTTVEFLGCYDTVAALGMPYRWASVLLDNLPGLRHRFHNFDLSPSVVHAYHALALDDERRTFHPLLWEPIEETRRRNPEQKYECKRMRQVWFAGMHTDVGGGYAEQTLSDIPLVWLTQHAVEQGLHIYPGHHVVIEEDADGTMHDSRAHGWTRLYRKKVRTWDRTRTDRPVVHESVLKRTLDRHNRGAKYESWILDEQYDVEQWWKYQDQRWHPDALKAAALPPRVEVHA